MLSAGAMFAVCGLAEAQTSADPMGEWVMRIGQRTLFVLSIHAAEKAGQVCAGSLSRPQHFQTAGGSSFNHVQGPTGTEPIVACARKGDSLSITVENPTDRSDRDTYQLTVRDKTHADLQIEDAPIPPMKLERATGAVAVSTDWDPNKSYSADDDMPSNAEMKRIFDEDQKLRQSGLKSDFAEAARTDAERREETRKLLSDGALHTGEDFWRAAFVFQHGSTPEDYLLAHTLAIVALKKGEQDGAWIAAATLDRYLDSIHQPQIYGTQFHWPKAEATTQEPYNRTLISDSLRKQMGVPSLEQQQVQLKQWNKERGIQ
jgi:hypothetical protein